MNNLRRNRTTSALQVFRHRELAQEIAGLTEDIEELKNEKALLLNQLDCADDHGIGEANNILHLWNLRLKL